MNIEEQQNNNSKRITVQAMVDSAIKIMPELSAIRENYVRDFQPYYDMLSDEERRGDVATVMQNVRSKITNKEDLDKFDNYDESITSIAKEFYKRTIVNIFNEIVGGEQNDIG